MDLTTWENLKAGAAAGAKVKRMRVRFENVGRGKRSWTFEPKQLTDEVGIIREIRKNGGLASRGIDVDIIDGVGVITAGFHEVGTFTIEVEVEQEG